ALRLLGGDRKPFDGKDVQLAVGGPGSAPEFQKRGDVEPGPEPELPDCEPPPSGPGLRQAATGEEHRLRLGQTVLGREVDVAEQARTRLAVVAPGQRADVR